MLGIQLGTVKSRLHYALRGAARPPRARSPLRRRLPARRRATTSRRTPRDRARPLLLAPSAACWSTSSTAARSGRTRPTRSPTSSAARAAPSRSSRPILAITALRRLGDDARGARAVAGRLAAAPRPDHGLARRPVVMSPLAGVAMSFAIVTVLVLPFRLGSGGELRWDDMPTPTVAPATGIADHAGRSRLPGREPARAGRRRSRGGHRQPPDEHPGGGTSSAEGGAPGQAEPDGRSRAI